MNISDAIEQLCATLAPEIAFPHEFELSLGILIAKHRRMLRQSAEVEAARLLHIGAANLAERQQRHRSTIYRRAERGRKIVAALA